MEFQSKFLENKKASFSCAVKMTFAEDVIRGDRDQLAVLVCLDQSCDVEYESINGNILKVTYRPGKDDAAYVRFPKK